MSEIEVIMLVFFMWLMFGMLLWLGVYGDNKKLSTFGKILVGPGWIAVWIIEGLTYVLEKFYSLLIKE